jgi:hypothetical protein
MAETAYAMSRLDQIESFRNDANEFELKMHWPDLSPINHNVWRQTNKPWDPEV